ncbi:MAG: hypothetical protein JF887_08275 [Candidatus Dormibacteraeota bacterium]|uniref:SH3b domain-containing protein n=1 Tax=Candidatus Amunia macphersoniae TaxID=3127014 RepID=A0A934N9U3_9BACT|nr:hypothetical protein [Candidatus Dormibacteraeota bacterium]
MTGENLKEQITGWCNATTGLQLVEDRSEPSGGFVLGLRSAAQGSGTVPVDVVLEHDSDRVTIRSTSNASAGSEDLEAVLASRPALVRGQTTGSDTVLTAHVYVDGFTKQAFMAAVDEIAKTRGLLDGLGDGNVGTDSVTQQGPTPAGAGAGTTGPFYAATSAQPEPSSPAPTQPEPASLPAPWSQAPMPAQQPAASQLPAPSFGSPSPSQGGYAPLSGQPAPQAQPAAAFAPTHTVPPQGMQAWAAPDPTGAVVATLGGGLPIQITEVRGAWANILCSNGWRGWVDGRIIGVAR